MKKTLYAFLILFAFCFAKCEKDKIDSNGLPPATQEGKNTLGYMLNGQPWTPQGFSGTGNLSVDFDSGVDNGVVGISGYRIITNNNREYFGIGINIYSIITIMNAIDDSSMFYVMSNITSSHIAYMRSSKVQQSGQSFNESIYMRTLKRLVYHLIGVFYFCVHFFKTIMNYLVN